MMTGDQIASLFSTVIAGLLVAAVTGNIVMFRQIGKLETSLEHLAKAIKGLTESHEKAQERDRDEKNVLHKRIDRLHEKRADC